MRGAVSIGQAVSLDFVNIFQQFIVKCVNLQDDSAKKDSSTMGYRYLMEKGVYVAQGGIYPQLARLTGFSVEDSEILKDALIHIFENDYSAIRPIGSMDSHVIWCEHDCPNGRVSPAGLKRMLNIQQINEYPYYTFDKQKIDGVTIDVY